MALETLKSSCSHYNGRRLWLGKAALRSRLVDVRGWRGGRRFRESIPLEEVESVARSNSKTGGNLVFEMKDGSERSLRVSAPGIWRMQIDYRLRRISGQVTADAPSAPKTAPVKVDRSLPTADEVEHTIPVEEGTDSQDTDHGSELAVWPRFETEEATIEIVAGTDLEPEFLIEPVAVTEEGLLVATEDDDALVEETDGDEREEIALVDALSFEIEAEAREDDVAEPEAEAEAEVVAEVELLAPEAVAEIEAVATAEVEVPLDTEVEVAPVAEAREMIVPPPEDLHEIGDDVVFDLAMDATTHEDVVMGWLSPVEAEGRAEIAGEVEDEDEVEPVVAEAEVRVEAEAEAEAEAGVELEAPAEAEIVAEVEVEVEAEAKVDVDPPKADIEAALEVEFPTTAEAETTLSDMEVALQLDPTEAEMEIDAKPLIAEIEVEAPDVGVDAGLEVDAPSLELDAPSLIAEAELEIPAEEVEVPSAEIRAPDVPTETVVEPPAEPEFETGAEAAVQSEPDVEMAEADPAYSLPIAARPFELSRVYETPEPEEAATAPEPAAAPAPEPAVAQTPEPAAAEPLEPVAPEPPAAPEPEISIEPVTRRERRRRQSMADLRPMSLAELIRESEPRWTRLAEMD